MTEDPLERIARQESEKKNTGLKTTTWVLAAIALVLAGSLLYIWYQKSQLISDLNVEKQELTEQMVARQNDYATLSSDYDTINSQLDSSREETGDPAFHHAQLHCPD